MAKKKTAVNREAADIPAAEFLTAWHKAETKADVMEALNLQDAEGNKTVAKLKGKYERMGLELKKLKGGGGRGRAVDTEALEAAWKLQAKLTGESFASVKRAAEAKREELRERQRQYAKGKKD